MKTPLDAKEVAEKIYKLMLNYVYEDKARDPAQFKADVAAALESYAEEKARQESKKMQEILILRVEQAQAEAREETFLGVQRHVQSVSNAHEAGIREGLEKAAKVAEDSDECVCTDDVNCQGSVKIAKQIRALAKCRERGMKS